METSQEAAVLRANNNHDPGRLRDSELKLRTRDRFTVPKLAEFIVTRYGRPVDGLSIRGRAIFSRARSRATFSELALRFPVSRGAI